MKEKNFALFAVSWISFFWGTTYIAAKIATEEIPGLFVSAVRLFIAGIIICSYFLIKNYTLPGKKELLIIFYQSIFLLIFGNGVSTWAMQYISGGLASIISAIIPLEIVLFSIFFTKTTRVTGLLFIGLLAGAGGLFLIFHEYLDELMMPEYRFGIFLSFFAGIMWSIGTVYTSKQQSNTNLFFSVGLQMLMAGIVLIPISILSGQTINLQHAGTDALISVFYLIVVGSIITYSLFIYANSKLPAARVSIYAYINPLVAIFLGSILLHEKLNAAIIIGAVITLASVFLVNHEFKKQASQ